MEPFDKVASLFWNHAVGAAPANLRLDWSRENDINRLVDAYLVDIGLPERQTRNLSVIESHGIWSDMRKRVCRLAADVTAQVPSTHPFRYYSVAIIPRVLLVAFFRSIGYPDLRRVLFEENVSEGTIPDIATLMLSFLETYRFEHDLMKRGSQLTGPRPHGQYRGDPVLAEQLFRWEDPSLWPLPPPMATGLLQVLSSMKLAALGDPVHYSLTSQGLRTLRHLGVPSLIVERLLPADEDFRSLTELVAFMDSRLDQREALQYKDIVLSCASKFFYGSAESCIDDLLPLCQRAANQDWLGVSSDVSEIQEAASRMDSGRSLWMQAMSQQWPLRMIDLLLSERDTQCSEWAVAALIRSGQRAMRCLQLLASNDSNDDYKRRLASVVISRIRE